MSSPCGEPTRVTPARSTALVRLAMLYLLVQLVSYLVIQDSCSPHTHADIWLHGALGPLAAVEAIPNFRYGSILRNAFFIACCLLVLVAPFAYVFRPRVASFVVSIVSLVVWCLFGMGFTIHHI